MTQEAKQRIEHCLKTKETTLKLAHSDITDYAVLTNLTHVTHLTLPFNASNDLTPLSKLTKLTTLYLGSNHITDISPLAQLTNLTTLSLAYNSIKDLTPLKALKRLENINLRSNKITDIKPLEQLDALESIDLSRNSLSKLPDLDGLNKLTSLNLSANKIDDLTFLSPLTKLLSLDLNSNHISDLKPLSTLIYLQSLDLSANKITDVTSLASATRLHELNLRDNQIVDVSALLYLHENKARFTYGNMNTNNRISLYNNPLDPALITAIKLTRKAVLEYFDAPTKVVVQKEVIQKGLKKWLEKEHTQKQYVAKISNPEDTDYQDILNFTHQLLDKADAIREKSGLRLFTRKDRYDLSKKIMDQVLALIPLVSVQSFNEENDAAL